VAELTTAETIELVLAGSTFLLAAATVLMAKYVRHQAKETGRLAGISQRQLDATTTPVIRVMRDEEHDLADMVTVNKGAPNEKLVVRLENRGPAPAEIEQCSMAPGGGGKLADAELTSPTLEPNGEWDVDFNPSDAEKAAHEKGDETLIQVEYLAIGSGARFRLRTYVTRKDKPDREAWRILREEQPVRLGEPGPSRKPTGRAAFR
jgi:hypothetical protein